MLFRKRHKYNPAAVRAGVDDAAGTSHPRLVHIPYDMMLKGSVSLRNGEPIRQYCVVAGGLTRLVTSGDIVDCETYEALLAAGAVRQVPAQEEEAGPGRTELGSPMPSEQVGE